MTISDPNQHTSSPRGDERLRRDGQRVEALLEELRGMTSAPTYQRIEELVQRVVLLYGAGLERLSGIALANATPHEAAERICDDELLAGLLLIHGIHPSPPGQRIRAALSRLGIDAELIEIDESNMARVRSNREAAPLIERAVLDAAPELDGAIVEDASPNPELVQIRSRSRR